MRWLLGNVRRLTERSTRTENEEKERARSFSISHIVQVSVCALFEICQNDRFWLLFACFMREQTIEGHN